MVRTHIDLVAIQYLRAIAALMVLVFHVPVFRVLPTASMPQWLAGGVDIFFVVSGFIMWVTTNGSSLTPLAFYVRRIRRIVPLYWILTLVVVAVSLTVPAVLKTARFDLAHTISSLLFLPARHPTTGLLEPVLIPGWTLNYEMFFYAIFGLTLLIPKRIRLTSILSILATLVLAGTLWSPEGWLGFYSAPVILEFGFGLAIGAYFANGRVLPSASALWIVAIGFFLLITLSTAFPSLDRLVACGVPAALIVVGAVSLEQNEAVPWIPGLRAVGDASYSIYLSHGLMLSALGTAWARFFPAPSSPALAIAFVALSIPAAVICGLMIYVVLERNIRLRLRWRTTANA